MKKLNLTIIICVVILGMNIVLSKKVAYAIDCTIVSDVDQETTICNPSEIEVYLRANLDNEELHYTGEYDVTVIKDGLPISNVTDLNWFNDCYYSGGQIYCEGWSPGEMPDDYYNYSPTEPGNYSIFINTTIVGAGGSVNTECNILTGSSCVILDDGNECNSSHYCLNGPDEVACPNGQFCGKVYIPGPDVTYYTCKDNAYFADECGAYEECNDTNLNLCAPDTNCPPNYYCASRPDPNNPGDLIYFCKQDTDGSICGVPEECKSAGEICNRLTDCCESGTTCNVWDGVGMCVGAGYCRGGPDIDDCTNACAEGGVCYNGTCDCYEDSNSGFGSINPPLQYLGPIVDLMGLIENIYKVMLPVGVGIFAIPLIIINGYKLMTSQGDPAKTKEGKEGLTAAILGLIFLITGFTIFRIIIEVILGGVI